MCTYNKCRATYIRGYIYVYVDVCVAAYIHVLYFLLHKTDANIDCPSWTARATHKNKALGETRTVSFMQNSQCFPHTLSILYVFPELSITIGNYYMLREREKVDLPCFQIAGRLRSVTVSSVCEILQLEIWAFLCPRNATAKSLESFLRNTRNSECSPF